MLTYDLRSIKGVSLYDALYRSIRSDIESGAIRANEKLPAKRALASHLGVSVITVESAYAQLIAEGYVRAEERKGYFATALSPAVANSSASGSVVAGFDHRSLSYAGKPHFAGCVEAVQPGRQSAEKSSGQNEPPHLSSKQLQQFESQGMRCVASESPLLADFTASSQATGAFPYKTWAKTVRAVLTEESEETLFSCMGAQGSLRLRQALARYLHGFRGMNVSADQIVIGSGSQTLYGMLVQLLGRSKTYAIENPGYRRLARIYAENDVQLRLVSLDDAGVNMSSLGASGAQVLHCMPSHQLPLGLVTTVGRRYELLSWASKEGGRYIVEDDYDCEFRMAGRPIPALQSIDESERVIYANTFTKSLGAAFRISYMVLPPHLAESFRRRLGFYSCTVGGIDQLALARFIETGEYERHVNRVRNRCRRIQDELIASLRALPASHRLKFDQVGAGLHFLMTIDSPLDEEAIANEARALGIALAPVSGYRLDGVCDYRAHAACAQSVPLANPAFVMNFAGVDVERIPSIANAFGVLLQRC